MPHSPRWLSALMRVREQRRDTALQSLGKSLLAAKTAGDVTQLAAAKLSQLTTVQQQDGSLRRVDVDRLRQLRANREDLRAELTEHLQRQEEADAGVKRAQTSAVARDSEVEVLSRLADRYLAANRIDEKRREEQIL